MPLRLPDPPADVTEAVRSTVQSLRGTSPPGAEPRAFRSAAAGGPEPTQLELTSAHEVYNLGLGDLVGGATLAGARPVGWRYLVREAGRVIASAETVGADGGTQVFSQYNQGPFVSSTADAFDAVEASDVARDTDLEARVLHIPALHVMAVWLHAGGGDTLVPLAPTPPGIEAGRSYPADDLLSTLADRAREVPALAPDDRRGG